MFGSKFQRRSRNILFSFTSQRHGRVPSPGSFPSKDLQVTSSDRDALLVPLKGPLPWMMLCGGWGGQVG